MLRSEEGFLFANIPPKFFLSKYVVRRISEHNSETRGLFRYPRPP